MSTQPAPFAVRLSAVLLAAFAVAQTILAVIFLSQGDGGHAVREVHGMLGMITPVVALVAAVLAGVATRRGGSKPAFWLALALTVVSVLQVGLGEMGAKTVHMTLGVALLAGTLWLVVVVSGRRRA